MAHVLCELGLGLMTQEELAEALGLTAVYVNRTLRSLGAEGVIVRSKRSISFPDWNRLRKLADFIERYLHLEPQYSRT